MKELFTKLGAIIYYELKLQKRSKALPGLMLGLLAMIILFGLLSKEDIVSHTGENDKVAFTLAVSGIMGLLVYITLVILCLPFISDIIPRDRQLGVADLLESLPLPYWVYLFGKLLSTWLVLIIGLIPVLILGGIWFWFILGSYDIRIALQILSIESLLLIFINPGLCILLTANLGSRRQALFWGAAFSLFSTFLMMFSFQSGVLAPTETSTASLLDMFSLARPVIFRQLNFYIVKGFSGDNSPTPFATAGLTFTFLVGLLEVMLAGLFSWCIHRLFRNR